MASRGPFGAVARGKRHNVTNLLAQCQCNVIRKTLFECIACDLRLGEFALASPWLRYLRMSVPAPALNQNNPLDNPERLGMRFTP
jgi:hypothetical protein